MPPAQLLRRLQALRQAHGAEVAAEKVALLASLGDRSLPAAPQVEALHEVLCFWRAYPDTAAVLDAVERRLEGFGARADVRRWRAALESTGIAGTDTVYPFGASTARWLASRWADRLSVEWSALDDEDRLTRALILVTLAAEVPGLDEAPLPVRAWLDRLRGPGSADGTFVVERIAAMPGGELVRDRVFEELGVPFRLVTGPSCPSRTHAKFEGSPVVFQAQPLRRDRPDLRAEATRPPRDVRVVTRRDAGRLIDLAREAMVTRHRDLDAFAWADPRDVRLAECGEGLQFACIGVRPERRFLLESVYGFLTLKNGVPIGYALASALFRSSEIAYNVFETFRAGEAAHVYGRLLGTVRALFGSDVFTIYPYQLGDGNDEGLQSGAWWFYYKLGFRPWARAVQPLVRQEVARVRDDPSYRTPVRTLKALVKHHLFLPLGRRRRDVIGVLPLQHVGLAVSDAVRTRFGSDRERAARVCSDEAARLLGQEHWRRLPPAERAAWERWGPLVAVLPGISRWSAGERRALADVVLAKGGLRESDFVSRFDAHVRLRDAVVQLTRSRRAVR